MMLIKLLKNLFRGNPFNFFYKSFDNDVSNGGLIISQSTLQMKAQCVFEEKSMLTISPTNYSIEPLAKQPDWLVDFSIPRKYDGAFYMISKSILIGRHGTVIVKNKIVLSSILNSVGYLLRNSEKRLLVFQKLIPNLKVYDLGISLGNCLANSFFHWLVETLPNIQALFEFEKRNPDLTSKAVIFINRNAPSFVYEYLTLMGIEKNRIVELKYNKVKVAKLIIPSVRFYTLPNPHDHWNRHIYPKTTLDFIRNKALNVTAQEQQSPIKKLYVSRNDADSRKILNEEALVGLLQTYGYEKVHLADLTVIQQIQLFRGLTHLITPHGAGQTNALFSTDLRIIELYPINRAFGYNYHYFQISAHYNHRHTMLLCDCDEDQNMLIDLERLATHLT